MVIFHFIDILKFKFKKMEDGYSGTHRKNSYSSGNYKLRDKESTRGMGFC
jgi:hypothetical protein